MNNKILFKLVPSFLIKGFFIISSMALLIIFLNADINGQSANNNELKTMSFNIRYGKADDGENSWQYRKDNTIAIVKTLAPDVFGLQEALKMQIDEFLKQLPNYAYVGVGRDDGKDAGEHSCIFYSKDRFTADTVNNFWFSDTPEIVASKSWGNNITRMCSWVLLKDKFTGKSFYFFNVHLDHISQPSREKSAQLLVSRISAKKLPVILTGDFNCDESNPAIKTILASGLTDTYRKLNEKKSDEGTFHAFSGKTNDEKIDFIFSSKGFEVIKSEIIHTSYNGKFPSDHFPVISTVSFK